MLRKQPKLHYINSGERCDTIKIEFTIDVNVLAWVAYELINYSDKDSLTKKEVEKELRQKLEWEGKNWIEGMEYKEFNEEKMEKAKQIILKLYPKWHINYHNKTLRYIVED